MRRFFGEIEDNIAIISGDEFLHLKTVLRMKEGDEVVVLDGTKNEYTGNITQIKKDKAIVNIASSCVCKALPKKSISVFQAFVKREKFELIVQKAVELGVKKFYPFTSKNCVAKDSINKYDRLEKIVFSACKQCECSVPMSVQKALSFEDMLKCASKHDIVLFANERDGEKFDFSNLKNYKNIAVIIGPEGGFTEEEKKRILSTKAESISLGNRILRSETASIVLIGIASVLSEN